MCSRAIALSTIGLAQASDVEEGLVLLQAKAAVIHRGNQSASKLNDATSVAGSDSASPLKSRYDSKCMDYNYNNGNVYMHNCHNQANQLWYMDSERLKTKYNDLCLDMNHNNGNVYMHACHAGSNQQWFFDGEDLKTRYDMSKCLDYNANNGNIYMHACHGGSNQKFYYAQPKNPAYFSRVKSRQGEQCMDYNTNDNNIYFHACHDGANQKFNLDGTALKSLHGDKCADYNSNNQNVYMHSCHSGANQQWYFDGENLKTKYNNKCLDLHMEENNVYMHNCHGGDNQKFFMEGVLNGLDHDEVRDEIEQEEIEQRDCKGWCDSKKHRDKAWIGVRCAWKACAGCSPCN